MNINVLGYIIYLATTAAIIYRVGNRFHRRGRIFILALQQGNESSTDAVKNMLLTAN
jgi:hypothetical protein